jgi:hypothetical protein
VERWWKELRKEAGEERTGMWMQMEELLEAPSHGANQPRGNEQPTISSWTTSTTNNVNGCSSSANYATLETDRL